MFCRTRCRYLRLESSRSSHSGVNASDVVLTEIHFAILANMYTLCVDALLQSSIESAKNSSRFSVLRSTLSLRSMYLTNLPRSMYMSTPFTKKKRIERFV